MSGIDEDDFQTLGDLAREAKSLSAMTVAQDPRYKLGVEMRGQVLVLRISGTLMQAVPVEFGGRLERMLADGRVSQAVIDLQDCVYVSSTVLGYLVKWFDLVAGHGARLMLTRPPDKVLKVIRLVGLESMFDIVASVDEAVAARSG